MEKIHTGEKGACL